MTPYLAAYTHSINDTEIALFCPSSRFNYHNLLNAFIKVAKNCSSIIFFDVYKLEDV